jgi:hypothetical protein
MSLLLRLHSKPRPPSRVKFMRLKLSGDINIESVYTADAGPSAVQSIEKTTPGKIGTMLRTGVLCGDSGYAMEEMLLGGRLRHRHVQNMELFQVMKLNEWLMSMSLLCANYYLSSCRLRHSFWL